MNAHSCLKIKKPTESSIYKPKKKNNINLILFIRMNSQLALG